jgi:hypothetical protein
VIQNSYGKKEKSRKEESDKESFKEAPRIIAQT